MTINDLLSAVAVQTFTGLAELAQTDPAGALRAAQARTSALQQVGTQGKVLDAALRPIIGRDMELPDVSLDNLPEAIGGLQIAASQTVTALPEDVSPEDQETLMSAVINLNRSLRGFSATLEPDDAGD